MAALVIPAELTPEPESGGPYAPTVRAEVAGMHIAAVELWHSPTPSSPRGTVLVLANGDDRSAMVEIDIATATPLSQRRLDLPPGAGLLMRREGDQIHLGVQGDDAFLWITLDATLSEIRRTALPRMGRKTLIDRYDAFGVHDGHAIVLTHGATAHVFDGKGRKTGVHSCAPLSFFGFTVGHVAFVDGSAFILNLQDTYHDEALCGFRVDGGATTTASYAAGDALVALGSHLYLLRQDGDFFALNDALRPQGPAVDDPRPILPKAHCRVTGDVERRDVWAWDGTDVVLTGHCCGGPPSGLFFCAPRGAGTIPPPGTPGYFTPGVPPRAE